MKPMNKKADSNLDSLIPGRLVTMMLVLIALIFVLFAARAYMLYQAGLSGTGVVQHFYLESEVFDKNPGLYWSPAETKDNKIYMTKNGRSFEMSRQPGDMSQLSCPLVSESQLSKVKKTLVFDPAYNGTETEREIFYNGENIKESEVSFKIAEKLGAYTLVLTRKQGGKATFDERMQIIKNPENGFLIVIKMADDYEKDNIARAYVSSEQSPTYKKMSHLLACSIMNSFMANSKESITGVSIIETVPKKNYEKLLNVEKPAIVLEVSNFNYEKGIDFALSTEDDGAIPSLTKGIDNFFVGGKKIEETGAVPSAGLSAAQPAETPKTN